MRTETPVCAFTHHDNITVCSADDIEGGGRGGSGDGAITGTA